MQKWRRKGPLNHARKVPMTRRFKGPLAHGLMQGYSNGGPRSESGSLDGDGRTSSASQRCILYPEFLSQNFAALAVLLKHLLLANCVIVDQAIVQLNCSAHLSWASYDFLVQSNCFVMIFQR